MEGGAGGEDGFLVLSSLVFWTVLVGFDMILADLRAHNKKEKGK
jgi:hypothetical protein